jgi:uncharacterized membrane protein YagU involved in acid resistance
MRAIRTFFPVFVGGLVAETLDILYAISFWAVKANVPPKRILQSVATGLLGRESFGGGWPTASLGLALHFFIALSMAYTYYVLAQWWPLLHQRPWPCGAVYGLILYLAMNLVVIPLSAAAPGSKDTLWVTLSVAVHMLLIGVPIAISVRQAMNGRMLPG